MLLRLLYLGPARDLAGVGEEIIDLPAGARAADLAPVITAKHPSLGCALSSMRLAVNLTFVQDDHALRDGDEVAVIPPVSGGAGSENVLVSLKDEPINTQNVRAFVCGDPACGGIVSFEGSTRMETDPAHGNLACLEYEAYPSMAMRQMESIAATAREQWNAGRVALFHRLGKVPPGEVSVMIMVACAHRGEAFEACRWLIDELKRDVAIWKRDLFEDGFVRWVEPPADARAHRGDKLEGGGGA
jgi:molybdopterin synthase catalytic subunit